MPFPSHTICTITTLKQPLIACFLEHYFVCVQACVLSLQLCLTLCDSIDGSLPGSSVHGILQTRILEWVAMPSSRGSSQPRDQTHISYASCIAGGFFTAEPPTEPGPLPYFLIISLFLASSLSFTNATVATDSLCSKAFEVLHCLLH